MTAILQQARLIEFDAAAFEEAIADLQSAAEAFAELPDIAPEVRENLFAALERMTDASDGGVIKLRVTEDAEKSVLTIDRNGIRRLAAALRAGDVELCHALLGHDVSPSLGRASTVDRVGEGG